MMVAVDVELGFRLKDAQKARVAEIQITSADTSDTGHDTGHDG